MRSWKFAVFLLVASICIVGMVTTQFGEARSGGMANANYTISQCSCHGSASTATITAVSSTTTPSPGQQMTITITVSGGQQAAGQQLGVMLLTSTNAAPSADGWVIVTDSTGATAFNWNEIAWASPHTFTWTVKAPTTVGLHTLNVYTNHGGGREYVKQLQTAVTVTSASTPPSVTITQPLTGTTLSGVTNVVATITPGLSPVTSATLVMGGQTFTSPTIVGITYTWSVDTRLMPNGVTSAVVTAVSAAGTGTATTSGLVINNGPRIELVPTIGKSGIVLTITNIAGFIPGHHVKPMLGESYVGFGEYEVLADGTAQNISLILPYLNKGDYQIRVIDVDDIAQSAQASYRVVGNSPLELNMDVGSLYPLNTAFRVSCNITEEGTPYDISKCTVSASCIQSSTGTRIEISSSNILRVGSSGLSITVDLSSYGDIGMYYLQLAVADDMFQGQDMKAFQTYLIVPPDAPTGLSSVPGNSQSTISWAAPLQNGGAAIDYYVVFEDGVELGTHPSGLNWTIFGLSNGQSYTFAVVAHNLAGMGLRSSSVTTIPYTVPDAPIGLTASPGNAEVLLTWVMPPFDGGRNITNYMVYRSTSETGTYALIASIIGISCTDAARTNGLEYYYRVSAVNQAGEGSMTGAASAIPYTIPDAPIGLLVTPGDTQASLNWNAPAFNGGRAIDRFVIYQDGVALSGEPSDSSITITGLSNGHSYTFSVAAHNLAGNGSRSVAVATVPYTVPEAPTGLTVVAGNSSVNLNWTAPGFDGGRPVDHYVVFQDGVALEPHPTGNAIVISGLRNGQDYSFCVTAHNLAGEGNRSSATTATPFTVPDAPAPISLVPASSQAILNWSAPGFNGGRAIDYYLIYQDGNPLPTHQTGLGATITGLTNGQAYAFAISAHNLAGEGIQSNVMSSTPYTVPDIPRGLVAAVGNAQLQLSWTAPVFDGGRAIDYYVVFQDGVMLPAHSIDPTIVIYSLNNGQNYSFAIAAHNLAGIGAPCLLIRATPATSPGSPIGLTATPGSGKVSLAWQAPLFDGGSPIKGYHIYRGGQLVANVSASTLTFDDTTGKAGTIYTYTVVANNSEGIGLESMQISASPQADNTLLYAGIAIAVIAVIAIVVVVMRRKK